MYADLLARKLGESPSQKPRLNRSSDPETSGILNEVVLVLVFESMKWDIQSVCRTALVSRKFSALARRLLWRELCYYRAPGIMSKLTKGQTDGRFMGGWNALAKLLFFCGGSESTRHFKLSHNSPGHFAKSTRYSKTSGRSFLVKKCRGDVLYVSDPCEHQTVGEKQDDLGIFRGVFGGFYKSRTRGFLVKLPFETGVKCSYCGTRVWSMTAARLISRRSAARRLGSSDEALEYFVCLNGHLHGMCLLVSLSSDDENDDADDEQEKNDDDEGEDSEEDVDVKQFTID